MNLSTLQINAINGAVWLVGIGVLIVTGFWWPGIMFLVGISSIIQALSMGQGWVAFQGAIWTIGIGVWALTGYNILVLFILIALSGLVAAFFPPPILARKPPVDTYLE